MGNGLAEASALAELAGMGSEVESLGVFVELDAVNGSRHCDKSPVLLTRLIYQGLQLTE